MVSQNVSRFNDSGLKRGTSTAAAAGRGRASY
jgi:hypothetical protein